MTEFSDLKGKSFDKVSVQDNVIYFTSNDGPSYQLYHSQDCCESVYIESINGAMKVAHGRSTLSGLCTTPLQFDSLARAMDTIAKPQACTRCDDD